MHKFVTSKGAECMEETNHKCENDALHQGLWLSLEQNVIRLPPGAEDHEAIDVHSKHNKNKDVQWDVKEVRFHECFFVFLFEVSVIVKVEQIVQRCPDIHYPCSEEHVACVLITRQNTKQNDGWLEVRANIKPEGWLFARFNFDHGGLRIFDVSILDDLGWG